MISAGDPDVLQHAARQAGLLVRTAGFPIHDLEDLRQDQGNSIREGESGMVLCVALSETA